MILPALIDIMHSMEGGGAKWIVKPSALAPDVMIVRGVNWSPSGATLLHCTCAKTALPFLSDEFSRLMQEQADELVALRDKACEHLIPGQSREVNLQDIMYERHRMWS
jgi:hypothetical protein